jgi:hypothetical protein
VSSQSPRKESDLETCHSYGKKTVEINLFISGHIPERCDLLRDIPIASSAVKDTHWHCSILGNTLAWYVNDSILLCLEAHGHLIQLLFYTHKLAVIFCWHTLTF